MPLHTEAKSNLFVFTKKWCPPRMYRHLCCALGRALFGGESRPEVFALLVTPDVRISCPLTPFKSYPPSCAREGTLFLDGIPAVVTDAQAWRCCLRDSMGLTSDAWFESMISAEATDVSVGVDFVAAPQRSDVLCGRWAVSLTREGGGGGLDTRDSLVSGMVMFKVRVAVFSAGRSGGDDGSEGGGGGGSGAGGSQGGASHGAVHGASHGQVLLESVELFFDVMGVMQKLQQVIRTPPPPSSGTLELRVRIAIGTSVAPESREDLVMLTLPLFTPAARSPRKLQSTESWCPTH